MMEVTSDHQLKGDIGHSIDLGSLSLSWVTGGHEIKSKVETATSIPKLCNSLLSLSYIMYVTHHIPYIVPCSHYIHISLILTFLLAQN